MTAIRTRSFAPFTPAVALVPRQRSEPAAAERPRKERREIGA
jgi:hypothetical protein